MMSQQKIKIATNRRKVKAKDVKQERNQEFQRADRRDKKQYYTILENGNSDRKIRKACQKI